MARFTPDSSLIDNYLHCVYRYKTDAVDEDGDPIYAPVSFQNDLEDITCTYDNLSITTFDPAVIAESDAAFASAVAGYDSRIGSAVTAKTLDLFQLIEYINDFLHVGSKTIAKKTDLPTKVSQLENDAGYATVGGTVQNAVSAEQDSDGNVIKTTYSTKNELANRVPASTGSDHKFVYTNSDGKITASDFEIWVTNE